MRHFVSYVINLEVGILLFLALVTYCKLHYNSVKASHNADG